MGGRRVIDGILDAYRPMLELQADDFDTLLKAARIGDRVSVNRLGFSMALPLFNRLPRTYLEVYANHSKQAPNQCDARLWEWFCRAHLIVDYLTGMADDFAVKCYHVFSGGTVHE
jgi:dGTPase